MLSNVKTIFNKIIAELSSINGEEEARSIAFILLEDLLKIDKTQIITGHEFFIHESLNDQLLNALDRLKHNEPIQYVLGKSHFYGHVFQVNREVLIPRQETEELVDWIIRGGHHANEILDIGTGSGCIAISLALGYQESLVNGWDNSETALQVASENAKANGANVTFRKVDVLSEIPPGIYELIVSNPPYVLVSEMDKMNENVLAFEPGNALFVEDQDPLLFYRRIVEISPHILKAGGWLYFEINESFAEGVVTLMKNSGFKQIEVRKDLNGKERMIRGLKPA